MRLSLLAMIAAILALTSGGRVSAEPSGRVSAEPSGRVSAEPSGSTAAAAADPSCASRRDVLNVSRVVEIDTSGGPKFGSEAEKADSFLEPGEIVLTFDDGPLRHNTQRVLAALDAECTKATFFSVGRMALADPSMLREVERRGHTVGSHTWSHRNLRAMPSVLAKQEVELGLSAVSQALGHPAAPFFRYPYLSSSHAMNLYIQSRNLAMFHIDVDAVDYRTHDPAVVKARVLAGLKAAGGRGIILFHDIQMSTAGALRGLLAELRVEGYHVVHIVAKAPAVTLPDYDAIAERELGRRKVATAANPLATRSVVWPNSGGTLATVGPPGVIAPGASGRQATGDAYVRRRTAPAGTGLAGSGANGGSQLPESGRRGGGLTATGATPLAPPAPRPARAPEPEPENWLTSIFRY